MNNERWENLTRMIAGKFEMEADYSKDISPAEGGGKVDVIICHCPLGKIKLERYVRPLILGKKTFYSKRGGSDTAIEYVYSKNETTQSLRVYKLDEFSEEWKELGEDDINALLNNS